MGNPLLRTATIASVLYVAAGAILGIVGDVAQGQGWMTFTLAQWVLLSMAFFTMPLLVVLWIGWAVFRRAAWRWSVTAFGVAAATIPVVYVLVLVLHWIRG
jgi:hypothetical protein